MWDIAAAESKAAQHSRVRLELKPGLVYYGFMIEISLHEAQTNLPALLQKVAGGEEIIISQSGAPIAEIVAVTTRSPLRPGLGLDVGKGWVADDFNAPLPDDLLAAFEGREA